MRKYTILLAVALVAMMVAGNAYATLIMDIQAVSATGGAKVTDTKDVDVSAAQPGDTITFNVWASFTTGTASNDSITQVQGGMASTRGSVYDVAGNLSAVTLTDPTWDYNGSQGGTPTANAMGDLVIPVTPSAAVWGGRASAAQPGTSFLFGSFTYTVTETGTGTTPTTVNFVPFTNTTVPAGTWKENGVSYSSLSNPKPYTVYAAGAPCNLVVPEPATLVLLGMGALALVFVRRRK